MTCAAWRPPSGSGGTATWGSRATCGGPHHSWSAGTAGSCPPGRSRSPPPSTGSSRTSAPSSRASCGWTSSCGMWPSTSAPAGRAGSRTRTAATSTAPRRGGERGGGGRRVPAGMPALPPGMRHLRGRRALPHPGGPGAAGGRPLLPGLLHAGRLPQHAGLLPLPTEQEDPGVGSRPAGDHPLRVPSPLLPRLHPLLQAEHLPLHRPALGPHAGLRHRLRHHHPQAVQRAPYVSSGQVLKMLGLILLLVLWFLAAWTVGMLENVEKNIPLVIRTQTARGLHFYICGHDRWDYMMVIAEMLFLLWGSFLCYATRAVPSAFHEPRYMGIALHNELMISAAFHVVRFIMVPSLHPDWTLLLFFAHTHGTITMTLALLFIPKFLHAGSPLREEIAAEVYEDELDMRRSGSCLNSSIASAWSEHSLDPDDIREELKKLYRQLEVHKTRRMAANNPHLPKKRSSRRSLGRSIVRRVTELPEAVTRRSSGERAGTPARRSSSAKLLPDAGGASLRMRDEGSRRRAAALRRSCSTEGPAREPPGGSPAPGSPSPGRKTMATTASEHSDSESLDAAPLVCKSASAHNLGGHGQPPPPRTAPLLKSLSVVAGSREEALLAASRAAREKCHAKRHPPAPSSEPPKGAGEPQSPGAADATPPAGSSPAEGWPQEDVSPPGDGKVQKRVTYAPIKSVSVDSSHPPGRVRVAVRRTPPPPPIRYQSLVRRATPAGDSPEPAQPPADPPARAAEPEGTQEGTQEGTAEAEPGRVFPPAGKGRLLTAASIPAQVCPWELIQDEILSQKQKATEAAKSGTPGDAAATPASLKPPPPKASLRGLGLAIKAFNRSKGKSTLKGKRESEGSLRKRGGSRRERPSLAETSAVSLGAIGRDPAAKSPEWSRQRPGSEPTAHPWQGGTVPCQHNNNSSTAWGAAGWGDSREEAEGRWDSPAPGTGNSETLGEEPRAPQGDVDAGGGSGVREIPPSVGHQEGAEHPHETPAVASSGTAQIRPQRGEEGPVAEPGKDAPAVEPGQDAPAAIVRLMAPTEGAAGLAEGLEVGSRPNRPQDHAEVQQPSPKPIAGSPRPSTAGVQRAAAERPGAEVCPQGAPRVPAGKAALLRQEAVAPQEDGGVPPGRESPAKALGKGGSRPAPSRSGDTQRVPAKSQSAEVVPAAAGKARSTAAEVCPGETRADSRVKIEVCPWEESGSERWGPGRAPGKGGSEGDGGHPGEEPGTEKPPAKTPELPKAASERAGSAEGRTAEVCPWESGEGGRSVRAEICPWDAEGAAPEREGEEGERRRLGKWVRSIRPKSLGLLRAQESGSGPQAPGRPWGSTGSEGPPPKPAPRSSELPEVASRSLTSPRASVCPWEVAGADSGADVCPWERGTALSDAGKLADGDVSQVKNGIPPQRAAPRGTRDTAPAADTGSDQRGSPSPREGAEQPGIGLLAKHPALPKTSPKQAGTSNSKKANVCPWEEEDEPLPKTEICPWEEPAAPSGKERPRQDTRGTSKGENKPGLGELEDIKAKLAEAGGRRPERRDSRILAKFVRKSLDRSKAEFKESQSTESIKEEVCPWESLGMEQPPEKPRARSPALPKSPSKKSQSVESLKAEVCPWESQELESTDKAEICPWEAAAPPPSKEKSRQDKDGPFAVSKGPFKSQVVHKEIGESTSGDKEKSRGDRESVCPWESTDTEGTSTGYGKKSAELLKGTTKKSESTERTKAEVCPWECQELESTDKAEICPWEAAAPPPGKEKSRQDKDGWSMGSRSPSTGQGLHKEIGESTSGDKEKSRGDRESVCPWESTDMEGTSTGYGKKSAELLKGTTKKSESTERTKAEVCPWECQELESTDKAEICPWEAAAPPPGKEKSKQDKDGPFAVSKGPSKSQVAHKEIGESTSGDKEKSRGDRESVCPWESTDTEGTSTGYRAKSPEPLKGTTKKSENTGRTKAEVCPWESLGTEQPPEKPRARSPALPKSPSKKSQSVESLKAEVCPWESQELESTDKAEICPWEGLGTEEPTLKTAMGKEPSKKSESTESRKSDICPWEAAEPDGSEKETFKPGAHPRGADRASPPVTGTSQPAAGASAVSPTALLKQFKGRSIGTAEHKPLCRIQPGIQPPRAPRAERGASLAPAGGSSPSLGSSIAEVCPWEAEEAPSASGETSTDTRKTSEVCLWEVESMDLPPDPPQAGQSRGEPPGQRPGCKPE
ncbi:probable G-protein coupled receptor 179 isoform X2 [Chroicocephalus ridibundus]|uniref:probable G-protein coupled receptor 179 isoform X2 n=1 Tax=Chroicocephalus ridibundus TaxID=1192867 RepID=UPI002FDD6BC8